MKITTDNILDALHKEPTLGYGGFHATAAEAQPHRGALITEISEVQLCVDWLSAQDIGQKVGPRSHSSYGLKHAVEYATGNKEYVSNGGFLVACIILGVPYKRFGGPKNPNAMVAVKHHRRNQKLHKDTQLHSSGWADYKPLPRATLIMCEGETNAESIRTVVTNQNVHVISLGSEFAATQQKLVEYAARFSPVIIWTNSQELTQRLMTVLPGAYGIKSPGGQDATYLLKTGKLSGLLTVHRFQAAPDKQAQEATLGDVWDAAQVWPGPDEYTKSVLAHYARALGITQ